MAPNPIGARMDTIIRNTTEDTSLDEGPGCGQADHDDDCLCDVKLTGKPPAPAQNVPLALTELREIHGDAVASLLETTVGVQARTEWAEKASRRRTSGASVINRLLGEGLSLPEIALCLGEPLETVARKLTKHDHMIPNVLAVDAALRKVPDGPISWTEVANQVGGVTAMYVRWHADKCGLANRGAPAKRYTEDQWAEVRRRYNAGHSYRRISKATGVPMSTLSVMVSRKGWARQVGHDAAKWAEARGLVESGESCRQASKITGIPMSTLSARAARDGWAK